MYSTKVLYEEVPGGVVDESPHLQLAACVTNGSGPVRVDSQMKGVLKPGGESRLIAVSDVDEIPWRCWVTSWTGTRLGLEGIGG